MAVKLRERPGKGWYVLIDWKGKRKAKYFGKNKVSAKAFAEKLTAKLKWAEQSGEPVALSRPNEQMPTVKDYFTEWQSVYADAHCKPSTAAGYRHVIVHHLIPVLGQRLLSDVTRADVKRFIASLVGQGKSKRTIHNILTPFKEGYHHAIDDGLVTTNPAANLGRLVTSATSADAHINPLSKGEVRSLLKVTLERYPSFYPLFLCAVRTGMREGELIGLQWSDLDFRGQFIEVRRAVVRRQVTTTKTHKIRRVDLSPQLATVLQALKETRGLEASLKGQPMPEWVFLTPSGHRMTNEVLRKAFYTSLDAAGLRRVRFHDLRHTFASLLIQQNANVKYIQEQLGHGSISITLDVYSHLFHGDHRHHIQRLDDPQEEGVTLGRSEPESATLTQPEELKQSRSDLQLREAIEQFEHGGVTERPNVPVLKTGVRATGPWVQIPPPPP
jgi:integrase